jgi:anti-sigma B factor antagonist
VGDVAVVTPPAQVDIGNSRQVRRALLAALADHGTVVVDMTGNVFCDSSGLQALVTAHRFRPDQELRVAVDHPHVRRVFEMTGADRIIRIFDTVADAVAAPPASSGLVGLDYPISPRRAARVGIIAG